jgi:hypothetical protein
MRITNRHHLPAAIVQAVSNDPYPHGKTGDISATSLIAPPQLVALQRQFADQLEEDAADRIWSLFGQSIHTILERADLDGLHEIRLFAHTQGWDISGQADRLAPAGRHHQARIIEDYKTTSVWAAIEGPKPEWVSQLYVLQWLAEQNGYQVPGLRLIALLRDWSRSKALAGHYPASPVIQFEIQPLASADLGTWIAARVAAHRACQQALLTGSALTPCTPAERWERPAVYAVKVPGRKSALRLWDSPAAAQAHALETQGAYVEHRPGEAVRCASYCPVARFCRQRQAELAADLALAA